MYMRSAYFGFVIYSGVKNISETCMLLHSVNTWAGFNDQSMNRDLLNSTHPKRKMQEESGHLLLQLSRRENSKI